MSIKLSTGLVNKLAGAGKQHLVQAATISFTASTKQILDSGTGLVDVQVGDVLEVKGSASNDGVFTVTALSDPLGGHVEVSETVVDEAAGATIAIACYGTGNSFKELFRNGVLEVYSGVQPSSADNAENGTKLVRITQNSLAFVAGEAANGLTFTDAADGILSKPSGEIWSGLGLDDNSATWFRFYSNDYVPGASTSAVRFDGLCGVGSGDLRLSSTSILTGGTITLDSVTFTFPKA